MKLSPQTIAANICAAAAAELEEQAAAAAAAASGNSNSTSTTTATSNNKNISATAAVSATVSTASVTNATSIGGSISSLLPGVHIDAKTSSTIMNQQQLTQQHQLQLQQQQMQLQQQQQQPANPPGKSAPKDTQVIAAILKEMGITEYEPRVLPQLVEFAYRKCTTTVFMFCNLTFYFPMTGYASRVLEDAQLFSAYAKKKNIDSDDVGIAVQMQMERSFQGPPPRDALLEIARNKNTQQLPPIKSHNGMRLPADRYSLVAANLRLVSANSGNVGVGKAQMMPAAKPRPTTSMLTKSVFPVKSSVSMNPGPSTPSSAGSDAMGVKRRLDES